MEAWQFPPNKSHISSAYRARHDQLWAEREWFYGVIERLPQIFSHQDCQRRHLFIRRGIDQPGELVAIDWAQCGLGPLGAELNHLVGMSAVLLEWPPAHVRELEDVYLLKSIIHDWDDDRCRVILANCRREMAQDARLLIIERIMPDRVQPSIAHRAIVRGALNMLVGPGGRERTEAEFRALLDSTGFRLARILPVGLTANVLEAVRI